MLGQKILPFGIGHTTNCFVQIQGTPEREGYLIKSKNKKPTNEYKMDDGSETEVDFISWVVSVFWPLIVPQNLHINSVFDLSHALSNDKVSSETLISLYWPFQNCDLLKAEVALLDSPGIDIDPDLDYWINHHCLDADVFVLVANAESTLTQTVSSFSSAWSVIGSNRIQEKSFFVKVKEKLSKPNIFILNNRWDACDDEEDYLAAVSVFPYLVACSMGNCAGYDGQHYGMVNWSAQNWLQWVNLLIDSCRLVIGCI